MIKIVKLQCRQLSLVLVIFLQTNRLLHIQILLYYQKQANLKHFKHFRITNILIFSKHCRTYQFTLLFAPIKISIMNNDIKWEGGTIKVFLLGSTFNMWKYYIVIPKSAHLPLNSQRLELGYLQIQIWDQIKMMPSVSLYHHAKIHR